MRAISRPLFPLATGLLCLLTLAPRAARAGDYKYPQLLPVLVLTVPAGWKVAPVPGPADLIVCTTPGDANFVVSLMTLPTATAPADRDELLTKSARAAAESAKLTDVTVSSVSEEKMGQGSRTFAMVRANGKMGKGSNATVVYGAFKLTDDGPYYLLGEAGPNASLLAHKDEFQKLANSIQPISPLP